MKGKIAVFVSVAAIAMFIAVPMASASGYDFWWKSLIHGEYAFTGSGACTLAPGGFYDNFTPKFPASANMGPNIWEGVYTFKNNGKGKMEARQCYNEGPNAMFPYSSGCVLLSWEFEYQMDGAEITFTFIPGTYYLEYIEGPNVGVIPPMTPPNGVVFEKPWTGRISPDGRNLFVFYGGPFKFDLPAPPPIGVFGVICNGVHQGFKTGY